MRPSEMSTVFPLFALCSVTVVRFSLTCRKTQCCKNDVTPMQLAHHSFKAVGILLPWFTAKLFSVIFFVYTTLVVY